MKLTMINPVTGQRKTVKQGFSWTTLFFGILVPLFRGDLKWFLIMTITGLLSSGIALIIFPFIYNKMYIDDLIDKGYQFV